jgi:Calcineurin-like phosphoesterase
MARRRLVSFSPVALVLGIVAAASFSSAAQPATEPGKASTSATTVRFVAIGDMGTGDEDQQAVARRMLAHHDEYPYDTVVTLGDNIYPEGHAADLPLKFERPYAELLARGVNFYASLGNHDVKKGRKAQINYKPFHMGGRSYYSFTKGTDDRNRVQFFAIDSTAFDGAQQRWLESALAGSRARWKLAYFHHPIYSSARSHGSAIKLRARLEPLLVRYGVAAAFSGHDHTYERTRPQQGVQYFVCGIGSGVRVGDLDRDSSLMAFGNDNDIGFMFVEVTADRLTFQAINAAGHVFDNGTIQPRLPALTTAQSQ